MGKRTETPTQEQIEKLPKWAQQHIERIEREREMAQRQLSEYEDDQTESSFYTDDFVCDGRLRDEGKPGPTPSRRYIQTHKITVDYGGIEMNVHTGNDNGQEIISIGYGCKRRGLADISFTPFSFQQFRLIHPDQFRGG